MGKTADRAVLSSSYYRQSSSYIHFTFYISSLSAHGLLQILNQIILVFNSNTQSDQRISQAIFYSFLSLGMDAWVIDAGWLINDSIPPRLSASENSFVDDSTSGLFGILIFQCKTHHSTKSTHLPAGNSITGMIFKSAPIYHSNFRMIS